MELQTKTKKYSEAQKKATKKYRDNNKEKINEQRKKYYQNRKAKDPNFLLYKRQKAKEYYAKKKALKTIKEVPKEEIKEEPKVEVKEEPKVEIIETPILDETKQEKKKRKYNKK